MNVRGRDNRHSIAMVQKLGLRIYDYARYSMLWIIFLKQLEMGMEILQPRKKERSIQGSMDIRSSFRNYRNAKIYAL